MPTIPNTEINDYTVSLMNDVLGRLGREAANNRIASDASDVTEIKVANTIQETQQPAENIFEISNYGGAIIPISILIVVAIAIAVWFAKSVKNKIKQREEFSGMGWGIANGITGLGVISILFVVIANSSINDEINRIKSKKYKRYAKRQMSDFVKTYAICLLIWIIISLIITFVIRYN